MAAKEVAVGKRLKISQAQQTMLLAVLGAGIVLGIAVATTLRFINQISFNVKVLAEEEKSIRAYSTAIRNVGVCKKPKNGEVYSGAELEACNPDTVKLSEIPGTLRSVILNNLAANKSLNSVTMEDKKECINEKTQKNYTYEELNQKYAEAQNEDEMVKAGLLLKSCSALRLIPDALPAFKNESALMASLNKIFNISNWEPENLTPTGGMDNEIDAKNTDPERLMKMTLNLAVTAGSETTLKVLGNIERSVREFSIQQAKIEWEDNGALVLRAEANAYYVEPSNLIESTKTMTVKQEKDKKVKTKK